MPVNFSIDGKCILLIKNENDQYEEFGTTTGYVEPIYDDEFEDESRIKEIALPEIEMKGKIRLPWDKNRHLAKYGKNKRIRKKHRKIMLGKIIANMQIFDSLYYEF